MMDTLPSKRSTKKRKADQVSCNFKTEIGLSKAEIVVTPDISEKSTTNSMSWCTCSDRYHVPCPRYSPGLEGAVPSEHVTQPPKEPQTPGIEVANAAPDCSVSLTSKDLYTDVDGDHSNAQLQEGVTGVCTYDESLAIRYRARESGLEHFFQESVVQRRVPIQKLCTTFGVFLPAVPSGPPDTALQNRLKKAIAIDIGNRIKLQKYNSATDAVALLRNARKIVVVTGAGISTSLNIPDFRSRGGLYSRLRDMGFAEPESVFSRDTFEQDPRPFFSVASMILPPTDGRFTPAHAFLRLLQDKGKLLTLYTQNVDGIDSAAGIRRDRLVQLHGSFGTATCISCGLSVNGKEIFPQIRNGEVPDCAECAKERQNRVDQLIALRAQNGRSVRRKTQSSINTTNEPAGVMRPDIVFMGEPPKPYLKRFKRDCAQVDLVIVMGTSLPVEPVSSMPNHIPPDVPQIYIGNEQMYPDRSKRIDFDIQLLGECDVVAEFLAKACAWDLKHEMLPENTLILAEPWSGQRDCDIIRRASMGMKADGEETKREA